MNRVRLLVLAGAVGVVICGAAFVQLRRANDRVEAQVRTARAERAALARRQGEAAARRQLIERARSDAEGARRELERRIEQARHEVAVLEREAQQQYDAKVAARHATEEKLAQNRDLTQGPVLVENCRNAGQATAVDAFQTLVWASLRGDDETVARLLAINGMARDAMQALVAALPESERAKYPTPEQFVALYVADNFTKVAAVQVLKETQPDAQHAVLHIARLDGRAAEVPMVLGVGGWQVAIDGGAAKEIGRYLVGAGAAPKP